MKLNTTKTFATFLKNEMKKLGLNYEITLEKLNDRQYGWLVDVMNRTDAYDYNTGLYSVLKVTYPYDYYACPKYITKEDLYKTWNKSEGNLNKFLLNMKNEIEIW